jgi:alpha-galactosidase
MNVIRQLVIGFALCGLPLGLRAQTPRPPIMGWSSWNHFRVNINEGMIREQADALVASGLYESGYRFINIDDGYFGGRDAAGKLLVDARKFPAGMPALVEYIHGKGLKAGIYTDAGTNTCGSIYDKDAKGIGVGIKGYVQSDCNQFFKEWKFDFLKVDWCGGKQLKLNEESAYSEIIDAVRAIDPAIIFNVCRWQFPGTWAIKKADSWRVSADIQPTFSSILKIIDLNAELYQYASPGHYNDMDMLQVGRGMSYDEDKTHFSMWCILNSPLLAGNDLRHMSPQAVEVLTNREAIAINQDISFVQARRTYSANGIEVWMKSLENGKSKAIAVLNRGEKDEQFTLSAQQLGIGTHSSLRDLWLHKALGKMGKQHAFAIPKHGILLLKAF